MSARRTRLSPTVTSSTRPVRLAILGCGRIAQAVHLPVLRTLSSIEVTAVAEPDEALRGKAQTCFPQAAAFPDWQEVLTLQNVDAVLIALPNALHAPAAVTAFKQGKHVYLEKPIALDLESAERVLAAWQSSDLVGAIGFNFRLHPLLQKLKSAIERGDLGELIEVRSWFSTAPRSIPEWKQNAQTGGGVLLDLASHHVDSMRFLFEEEIAEAVASTSSALHEADNAALAMRLGSGLPIHSHFSSTSHHEDRIEVTGSNGIWRFDRHKSLVLECPALKASRVKRWVELARSLGYSLYKLRSPEFEPSYRRALAHFADCIQGGPEYSPDLSDGLASLKVVLAALESAQTNRHENPVCA